MNYSNQSEYSVAVLLITPEGIPLIRDPKKPAPVYWKLPGGRSENDETAQECAVRETKEEIGVDLDTKALKEIYSEDRGNHMLFIYQAKLKVLPTLKQKGNEGEEIKVFNQKEILSLPDLFPNHKRVIQLVL